MGQLDDVLCSGIVFTILVFGSMFAEIILPEVESQLPTTLNITKLTSGGDGTFDFAVIGPTSYNSSINTASGGTPPTGEIVILNELQYTITNKQTMDFSSEFGIDSLVGQEVSFSDQIPTRIRIDKMKLTDFPNNDAALQFRIYSNYTLGVTEFKDLVLEASSDILFANATDYEVLGDTVSAQFNFTSTLPLTGTYAVSLVATNPNWLQGSEEQVITVYDDSSLVPGDCFSVNDMTNPSSIITRESGGGGNISCEDFPFKVYVQTTTNPRILWDDFRENYGNNFSFDTVLGTAGNGDHYIIGNRVNLTDSTILNVSIPALNCDIATNGTIVAKIWDRPTVGSTIIPMVQATSDTWGVIANANGDCDVGGFGPNNVFDITFNFTASPELTGEYFIGIEVDDFDAITQFDIFEGNSISHTPVPYDPVVFMGYNTTDGWVENLSIVDVEILGLRMAVIQNQSGSSGFGIDGPNPVDPGTYSISETVPDGWTLVSATCNDGSSSFSVDTISAIQIDSGDNIECTFENEFVGSTPDDDSDGIYNDVDTLPNAFSDDFSDIGLGGTSSGTITSRGDQILAITEESNPDGVRINADISGGTTPATVSVCGGATTIDLSPVDEIVVTCGSATIDVTSGSVDIIFISLEGTQATTTLVAVNSITFDPDTFSFIAPSTNTETIIIDVQGTQITLSAGDTISLLSTFKITKLTTGGDGTFDFTVTGPTSYNASISTTSGGLDTAINEGNYGFTSNGKYFENDIQVPLITITGIIGQAVKQAGTSSLEDQGEIRFADCKSPFTNQSYCPNSGATWIPFHSLRDSDISTFNFWVKGDFEGSTEHPLFQTIEDPNFLYDQGKNGIYVYTENNATWIRVWENDIAKIADNFGSGTVPPNDNQWHMITLIINRANATADKDFASLYIDTVKDNKLTPLTSIFNGGQLDANSDLIFGNEKGIGTVTENSFEIDDITIFQGPLNSTEISSLWNGGTGVSGSSITRINILLHVSFDSSSLGVIGTDGPTPVEAGTYSIQETIPSGWNLTTAICSDSSSSFSADTVSGIEIGLSDNIECTFVNEFSASIPDTDGDGISDDVDTLPNTVSDDFSDISLGGTSSGTITTRGNQILTITEESNPDGVRITADVSGGLLPAVVNVCGGISIITLSPGDNIVVTCGSATIDVLNGPVEVTFIGTAEIEATSSLTAGNSITFEPDTFSFVVPPTNSDPVVIIVDGEQVILNPGQAANVLSSDMDSFIKQGESNTNEGANTMMRIRDNGNNRALIYFDQDKIQEISQEKTLSSATLRLYIEYNGNNWGSNGRTIDVHKLLEEWTAGDGFNDKPTTMSSSQFNEFKNRGNGNGVTWKCATDTEINNQQTDCDTQWDGSTFSATPTDTITIFKDNPPTGTVKTVGWIEFDVTSDLQAFLSTEQNYGWIVKKTEEGATGLVEFTSGESASNMPELVLLFE